MGLRLGDEKGTVACVASDQAGSLSGGGGLGLWEDRRGAAGCAGRKYPTYSFSIRLGGEAGCSVRPRSWAPHQRRSCQGSGRGSLGPSCLASHQPSLLPLQAPESKGSCGSGVLFSLVATRNPRKSRPSDSSSIPETRAPAAPGPSSVVLLSHRRGRQPAERLGHPGTWRASVHQQEVNPGPAEAVTAPRPPALRLLRSCPLVTDITWGCAASRVTPTRRASWPRGGEAAALPGSFLPWGRGAGVGGGAVPGPGEWGGLPGDVPALGPCCWFQL